MDTKKTHIHAVYKRPTLDLGNIQTETKGMEKFFLASGNQKKAGVAILISEKIDFKIKTVTRDKEEHLIMIKESILEEDITKSYSNQDCMVLAQKQKKRSMEQDSKPRDTPMHLWSPNL